MSKIDTGKLLDELNARKGSSGSGRRESVKSDLTETQQADTLLGHLAKHTNPPILKPSDFVRYIPERRGTVRNGEKLHIVTELIQPPVKLPLTNETRGDPLTYRQYDVFISICDPEDKGHVLTYACDSRDLEMYPEGQRLKGAGTA